MLSSREYFKKDMDKIKATKELRENKPQFPVKRHISSYLYDMDKEEIDFLAQIMEETPNKHMSYYVSLANDKYEEEYNKQVEVFHDDYFKFVSKDYWKMVQVIDTFETKYHKYSLEDFQDLITNNSDHNGKHLFLNNFIKFKRILTDIILTLDKQSVALENPVYYTSYDGLKAISDHFQLDVMSRFIGYDAIKSEDVFKIIQEEIAPNVDVSDYTGIRNDIFIHLKCTEDNIVEFYHAKQSNFKNDIYLLKNKRRG